MTSPRTKSGAARQVQMCCITIGYERYLLPADQGMKVVSMMQGAIGCDRKYEGGDAGYTYIVRRQPEIELALIQPGQVRRPEGATSEAGPLMIGGPKR